MLRIRELSEIDLEPLRQFTDREIGDGYYKSDEIADLYQRSMAKGKMHSLVLVNRLKPSVIEGVRITYPAGQWDHGKGKGLNPDLWPHPLTDTAYFQSLFLSRKIVGQGWGLELSRSALRILQSTGSRGVVCHSWKESPHNSSARYLLKLGFQVIAEHREYWREVDYQCTRCLQPPCLCTAQEMYLNLEGVSV